MEATQLATAPVLSTPAEHGFEDCNTTAAEILQQQEAFRTSRTITELLEIYEIKLTAKRIVQDGWKKVALQFPDAMLGDAGWVVEALSREVAKLQTQEATQLRLYVLADTSYSACCVDEIAAEHVNADAVMHYGRACLSPTTRLPVLHVFTRQSLDHNEVVGAFEKVFPDMEDKVIIMADVMFQCHVAEVCNLLRNKGYRNVKGTDVIRDPGAWIPNRRIVATSSSCQNQKEEKQEEKVEDEAGIGEKMEDQHLFHISTPPAALLLTLSSRLASLHIYNPDNTEVPFDPSRTRALLGRRYALVTRLATASVIGILVNTLSVQNYLSTVSKLKDRIASRGRKSYTIIVGKLNAAKLANFAEVDGWVVVGCWESGLVEQDNLWKPVITPFELEMALTRDEKRVWDGRWWGGIEGFGAAINADDEQEQEQGSGNMNNAEGKEEEEKKEDVDDDESAPPEFDLRTGRLVSSIRPSRNMLTPRSAITTEQGQISSSSSALALRTRSHQLASINGAFSPGAEFLRSQRTWQGLGSDFQDADNERPEEEESTIIREGRSGVARGYTVKGDMKT